MTIIVHDLDKLDIKNQKAIDYKDINYCRGCFNCWTSKNQNCIFNDKLNKIADYLLNCDKLIIISKNVYGTYSYKTKKILERMIGYVYPYFTIRNKEIHHKLRTNSKLNVSYIFYGNITNDDKILLENLVDRNKLNFNYYINDISYLESEREVRSKLYDIIY